MPPRRVSNVWLLVVTALLLLGVAAFVVADHRSSSPATSATHTIAITNFMFHPATLTVAPGAIIRVTNNDTTAHTLSAVGGAFDTGNIGPQSSKEFHAPATPGTYQYMCNIHQFMMGTIIVR